MMLNEAEGIHYQGEDILRVVERAKEIVSDLDVKKIDLIL